MLDSAMVMSWPGPITAIRPKLRSSAFGKPGRRNCGTSHTVFIAFIIAVATPREAYSVSTMPMARAMPVLPRP